MKVNVHIKSFLMTMHVSYLLQRFTLPMVVTYFLGLGLSQLQNFSNVKILIEKYNRQKNFPYLEV